MVLQPDGFLTEERKAANNDHGFSTFFSETGMMEQTATIIAPWICLTRFYRPGQIRASHNLLRS